MSECFRFTQCLQVPFIFYKMRNWNILHGFIKIPCADIDIYIDIDIDIDMASFFSVIYRLTFKLILYLSNYEWSHYLKTSEYKGFSVLCWHRFLWVYSQEWKSRVAWLYTFFSWWLCWFTLHYHCIKAPLFPYPPQDSLLFLWWWLISKHFFTKNFHLLSLIKSEPWMKAPPDQTDRKL